MSLLRNVGIPCCRLDMPRFSDMDISCREAVCAFMAKHGHKIGYQDESKVLYGRGNQRRRPQRSAATDGPTVGSRRPLSYLLHLLHCGARYSQQEALQPRAVGSNYRCCVRGYYAGTRGGLLPAVSIGCTHRYDAAWGAAQRGCACAGMVRVAVRGGRAGGTQG